VAPEKPGFFEELKRRHVWRVAVAYAVAGWLLVQVATQVFPIFHMPDWTAQLVVLLLVLGFPVAVIFAWVFEITPEGIRRTEPAGSPEARPEFASRQIGRKLNTVIITVLVLAVAVLGWRLLVLRHSVSAPKTIATSQADSLGVAQRDSGMMASDSTTHAAPPGLHEPSQPAAFHPPTDTLVVLPFANLGGDPKQQYFSDGITEELTNALGQNAALRVIAWDTASKYRDSKESATEIAKALDVANVLTGKILRQGNAVRVIVELVNATTGYQTWSSHYDDSLANIFQVQDKITASISDALKVKFASAHPTTTVNPEAHDLVLRARALMQTGRSAAPYQQARSLLEQAIAIAPDYADAHALLARTSNDLTQYSTLSLKNALPKAREEANKALRLDPNNVDATLALASADLFEGKVAEARNGFQRAIEIDPSNAVAHLDYGNVLPLQPSLAQELEAVQLDPDNATAQGNLVDDYLDTGNYQQALAPAMALIKLDPHNADSAMTLAMIYAFLHRNEDAVKAFELVQPDTDLGKALIATGKLAYQAVLDPELDAQALAAVDALRSRTDLDPYSMTDLVEFYLMLGRKTIALELLPQNCAVTPVACSDLSVNPMFLPLHGDPAFEALVKKYDTTSPAPTSEAASPLSR
jgi:TolB-like protein/Tfp pilus assembly protein PilF